MMRFDEGLPRSALPVPRRGIGPGRCATRLGARVLVAALATGCAPLPARSSATGERDYAFKAPTSVVEADRKECAARADSEATLATHNVSYNVEATIGPVFGLIGAIASIGSAVTRTRMAAESAYETEMRTCLEGKGYALPK
jgi:hypothetical protein